MSLSFRYIVGKQQNKYMEFGSNKEVSKEDFIKIFNLDEEHLNKILTKIADHSKGIFNNLLFEIYVIEWIDDKKGETILIKVEEDNTQSDISDVLYYMYAILISDLNYFSDFNIVKGINETTGSEWLCHFTVAPIPDNESFMNGL